MAGILKNIMAELYTKLAQSIVYSSLWSEDAETCKIWVTVLALKDLDGVFRHNISGISRLTGICLEKCLAAFEKFESPDPLSTSKKEEGRRLLKLEDGGWLVVTHDVYQEFGWSEEKKRQNRERVAAFRERRKQLSTSVPECPPSSTPVHTGPPTAPVNPPAVPEVPPKTPKPEKTPPVDCITIFVELNDLTGSKFRPEGASLAMLVQRLAQPDVSCEGVLQMVRRQVKLWKDDPKMREFLRPTTLFNATKFNEYYAAREQPIPNFNAGKPNPRNLGIVTDGRSYGGGAKPRLERERQDLVPAVSQVGNLPAPGVNPAGV